MGTKLVFKRSHRIASHRINRDPISILQRAKEDNIFFHIRLKFSIFKPSPKLNAVVTNFNDSFRSDDRSIHFLIGR